MNFSSRDQLSRQRVIELLAELGNRLYSRGIRAEMYLVGGAAMALAYQPNKLTRDLDAIFIPKNEVYAEANAMIGENKDIGTGWLNDAVKGFLPPGPDLDAREIFTHNGIRVCVASPEHLLAMKVLAARVERDPQDILTLCKVIGIKSVEQVLNIAEQVYGTGRLTPKSQFLIQELLSEKLTRSE